MKDRVLRFSALLLVLWYCFSVIGFDIHTCKGSGRSFVATFVSGMACDDIHPEHHCEETHCDAGEVHSCCGSHDCCGTKSDGKPAYKAPSCCSNDYLALSITGSTSEEQNRYKDSAPSGFISLLEVIPVSTFNQTAGSSERFRIQDHVLIGHRDILSRNSVWRI